MPNVRILIATLLASLSLPVPAAEPGRISADCGTVREDAAVQPGPHLQDWEQLGLQLCHVADPQLPDEYQPLLDLPLPAMNETLKGALIAGTNPVAFGMTIQEGTDRDIVAFQLAAMHAQQNDNSRDHAFHWYGHPHFNRAVARMITPAGQQTVTSSDGEAITADVDAGYILSANGEVQLYGEFILPTEALTEGVDERFPAASRQLQPLYEPQAAGLPEQTRGRGSEQGQSKRADAPGQSTEQVLRRFPAVLAIEGLQGNIGMYRWWHAALADAGYIVYAFDFTGQGMSGGSDGDTSTTRVNDAERVLKWLLQESPVAELIDPGQVGIVGHSMGAITTLELQDRLERQYQEVLAADPEARRLVQAAVPAAPISKDSSIFELAEIPLMIQTGDHDGPIAPIPFVNPEVVRPVFDKLNGDRAMIVADAATHAQHSNYPILPTETHGREIAALYSIAWLDYYLRGDESALEIIRTAHPNLSSLHTSEVRIGEETTILREGAVPAGSTGGVLTVPTRP